MSALVIIAAVTLFALYLGVRARRGHDMNLEQWSVGGRSFGTAFVFLLMAGEIYTTFTFLGGSGFAYGKGAPVYYILAYGTLAYILSYWMLPPIWRYAKKHRLVSQPHFFSRKYDSPALGTLVALVGVAALIPYLVLQLKGLGIIVATASYGAISSTAAVWIGACVVTAYVIVSGVRGSAWNSVVKDLLILAIVLFLGIYLPLHYYGGLGDMFRAIDAARPGFLDLPGEWFERDVVPVDRAAHGTRLLHVAAHVRFDLHRQGRTHLPPQRDGAAVVPADPAVRVLRRLRGDAAGAGSEGRRHRPVAVPPVVADLRPVVRRRDRRGRHSDRAGARLDDPHVGVDAARQRRVSRHAEPQRVGRARSDCLRACWCRWWRWWRSASRCTAARRSSRCC